MWKVAYGEQDAGVVVDTHVLRVATRLRWADPAAVLGGAERVRVALEGWVPAEERVAFSLAVVGFGQLSRGGKEWGRAFVEHVRRHESAGRQACRQGAAATPAAAASLEAASASAPAASTGDGGPGGGAEDVELPSPVELAESIVRRMDGGGGPIDVE